MTLIINLLIGEGLRDAQTALVKCELNRCSEVLLTRKACPHLDGEDILLRINFPFGAEGGCVQVVWMTGHEVGVVPMEPFTLEF